ncbi:MAG: M18 family aminopeptidase [Ruthenibacterium sp.]
MDAYRKSTEELLDFIRRSPSCFHAVANLVALLREGGFTELSAVQPWKLCAGGKYYVTANGSALLAFTLPTRNDQGVHIVAAHSDAPCFKIKENPEIACESAYTTLNVEGYGGMLCAPWFDRPLSVAGRVVVEQDGGRSLVPRLVNFDRDLLSIVNLAIHMDRDANKGKAYQMQKDMLPLFSGETGGKTLRELTAQQLNVAPNSIVDADLFLYNRMAGTVWGAQEEFISAPRLDDLQCSFAAVQALLTAQNPDKLCMAAVFDNEEVGSGTKQGALSTLLADTLRRIALATGKSEEQQLIVLAKSSMLSADNGHALHPNYPEKCDKTNRPKLNGGVLIKYAANQKYTTDAVSGAALRRVCERAGIPYQIFVNHSDVAGGSTLGNLSATQVSVPTVDIGAAMLAMHSPYETGGVRDTLQLTQAMRAYYETDLL